SNCQLSVGLKVRPTGTRAFALQPQAPSPHRMNGGRRAADSEAHALRAKGKAFGTEAYRQWGLSAGKKRFADSLRQESLDGRKEGDKRAASGQSPAPRAQSSKSAAGKAAAVLPLFL